MDKETEIFSEISDHLRSVSAPKARGVPISTDTEIFYDLGIYGTDLYELFVWISNKYGLEMRRDIADFGPGEGYLFGFLQGWIRRLSLREPRKYRSLKVSDLLSAISKGQWPAS